MQAFKVEVRVAYKVSPDAFKTFKAYCTIEVEKKSLKEMTFKVFDKVMSDMKTVLLAIAIPKFCCADGCDRPADAGCLSWGTASVDGLMICCGQTCCGDRACYKNLQKANMDIFNGVLPHAETIRKSVCAYCRKMDKPKWCQGCNKIYYCSRDCQVKHWPVHKKECVKVESKVESKSAPALDESTLDEA